jgi:hypothetical protein
MVITIGEGQGYTDSGGHVTTTETSRLIENDRRGSRLYGIGRSRRYGSVDNPLFEELLRRFSSANSTINGLIVFNFFVITALAVIGLMNVVLPSSLTVYFGGVQLACGVLFYTCCLVVRCRVTLPGPGDNSCALRLTSFGNKLTNVCAVLSSLMLIACAFSAAQESTYFLTCENFPAPEETTAGSPTPRLKCPDGIINPPVEYQNIMYRVIFQGSGCFIFVILSITFSVQMCLMNRFMIYRRAFDNI